MKHAKKEHNKNCTLIARTSSQTLHLSLKVNHSLPAGHRTNTETKSPSQSGCRVLIQRMRDHQRFSLQACGINRNSRLLQSKLH